MVIIVAAVAAHLYKIDSPILEHHDLRQVDTAAIARNYYENGMRFFSPQVDWGGNSGGYVESEFPIYTYLVAILYSVFGWHEYLGRVLNRFFYIPSAILLFLLARQLYDQQTALLATAYWSFLPLSFYFFRSFQPEALASLCTVGGLYFFVRATEEGKLAFWLSSALGIAIACAIKPTNLYLGLPLLYLAFRKHKWGFLRQSALWLFAVATILPAAAWYTYAKSLWEAYGNTLFRVNLEFGIPAPTDPRCANLIKQLLLRMVYEAATPAGLIFWSWASSDEVLPNSTFSIGGWLVFPFRFSSRCMPTKATTTINCT
jgi:4-amino-4-deoxy-L-arabinose transferase-like glycosyltransferase